MNNNNFGRSNTPSNMPSYSNGDPFANFRPTTTNTPAYPTYNRVDTAFKQNNPFIDRIDYRNQNNLLHNNVGDNVLDEHVVEYRIHIDSADRDTTSYKDPFSYTVRFDPSTTNVGPNITRTFRNVKYVKLDSITFPRYKYIENTGTSDSPIYSTETSAESHIYDDRYILIEIDQLEGIDSRVYGTNTHLSNSFALVTPDKLVSSIFFTGFPYLGTRYFKDSSLANINKLNIRFRDSLGNLLKIEEVDNTITVVSSDPLASRQTDGTYQTSNGTTVTASDVRHPLFIGHQHHMTLIFGVVEASIDTDIQFSR